MTSSETASALRQDLTFAPQWRRALIWLAMSWLVIIAIFHRDALHLLNIWWTSSTFSHCLLLLPIIGWLVWLRAEALAAMTPHGWAPGLLWVGVGALAWLLGEAAGVALARQAGLILMLQGMVPTLLGLNVTRALLFPLAYSLFLIPFGEELVPPMQMLTADMAMGLLRLFGIPAHIEGIFITTPVGLFAVAEACSGVKFLVAMAALAVLAAHLCFKSWRRRAVFLAVAMIVPVLANGFRAFSTIWIAENWGIEFAAGADHLIYGWLFFGLVIALLGLMFWPWFDRAPDDAPLDAAKVGTWPKGRTARYAFVLPVALALTSAAPLWLVRSSDAAIAPPDIAQLNPAGWQRSQVLADWHPRFDGADALDCQSFTRAGTVERVEVCVAHYRFQSEGRELVGYGQGAVDPNSDWRWAEALEPIDGMQVERLGGAGDRAVATLYALGATRTASPAAVKWATLRARLFGGDERATALLISSSDADGGRDAIVRFLSSAGGGDALLARLTATR